MSKNLTAEALRAAREARQKARSAATATAKPASQSQASVKKKAEELLIVKTDIEQPVPESHEQKSMPVSPEMAPAAPAAMDGAPALPGAPAPAGDMAPPAAELAIEVAPAGEPAAEEEAADEAVEESEEESMDEDEVLEAFVLDPARVSASAKITVAGPFESAQDAHYVLFADGEPLAKVQLSDQNVSEDTMKAASFRKVFLKDEYAQSIVTASRKLPLLQLLGGLRARPYLAAVSTSAARKEIQAELETKAAAEFKKKQAKFRDDFLSMMSLVTEAQLKNFLTEQPLRAAFFKQLKKAGVHDPVAVIEASFVEGAAPHFEDMTGWAMRWLDYDANALADIKQQINSRKTGSMLNVASYEAPVATAPTYRQPAPVPSSHANVPVVASATPHAPTSSVKDQMREQFSFRRRLHRKEFSPK